MRNVLFICLGTVIGLSGCIGDDFIDDFVEPELRITDIIDTIGVGETYQLGAQFFNNIGQQEKLPISWSSSDEEIAIVSNEGLLWARAKGTVNITALVETNGGKVEKTKSIIVAEETVENLITERSGVLKTTSTYKLTGSFKLSNENGLTLTLSEDFEATDVLPGLFVYLSNNPNSINGALEISAIKVFKGAQSFEILGEVGINDYSHLLFYCKPFRVKVGDGAFTN